MRINLFHKITTFWGVILNSWVFRANPATHFGIKQPPVLDDSGHLFRFLTGHVLAVTEIKSFLSAIGQRASVNLWGLAYARSYYKNNYLRGSYFFFLLSIILKKSSTSFLSSSSSGVPSNFTLLFFKYSWSSLSAGYEAAPFRLSVRPSK